MSFTVHLKSGERYEFLRIKTVKFEDKDGKKRITINGNFEHKRKYINIVLWRQMIQNNTSFEKWLKKTMKRYDYDGMCPNCESLYLYKFENRTFKVKLNDFRQKEELMNETFMNIQCKNCGALLEEGTLMYINVVVYYR